MKRTFIQRLSSFMREHEVARDGNFSLNNKGMVSIKIHNRELFRSDIASVKPNEDGTFTVSVPENHEGQLRRDINNYNDRILYAVENKLALDLNLKSKFAATLSNGQVVINIPYGVHNTMRGYGAQKTRRRYLSVMNEDDYKRMMSEQPDGFMEQAEKLSRWLSARDDARFMPSIKIADDGMIYTPIKGHDPKKSIDVSHKALKSKGGEVKKDGKVFFHKDLFINGEIILRDIRDVEDKIRLASRRAAEREKQESIARLRAKGIDASRDPDWVKRTPDGEVQFTVSDKAQGLIRIAEESGALISEAKGSEKVITFSHPKWATLNSQTQGIIKSEIDAVNRGANGSYAAMTQRVESNARKKAADEVRDKIKEAKRNRRGSVKIEPLRDNTSGSGDGLLGLAYLVMLSDVASAEAVKQEASSLGVSTPNSGSDEISIPSSSWDSGSSGSSYDYGSSSSSSGYDSGFSGGGGFD